MALRCDRVAAMIRAPLPLAPTPRIGKSVTASMHQPLVMQAPPRTSGGIDQPGSWIWLDFEKQYIYAAVWHGHWMKCDGRLCRSHSHDRSTGSQKIFLAHHRRIRIDLRSNRMARCIVEARSSRRPTDNFPTLPIQARTRSKMASLTRRGLVGLAARDHRLKVIPGSRFQPGDERVPDAFCTRMVITGQCRSGGIEEILCPRHHPFIGRKAEIEILISGLILQGSCRRVSDASPA